MVVMIQHLMIDKKDEKAKTSEGGAAKKESSKRKLAGGEYDPSSPTSETSDDSHPTKKAAVEGKSASKPVSNCRVNHRHISRLFILIQPKQVIPYFEYN